MAEEPLLTRYLVYETFDDGHTLHLRGEAQVRNSHEALRAHLQSQPGQEGVFGAVSENNLRFRSAASKVKTSIATESIIVQPVGQPREPREPEEPPAKEEWDVGALVEEKGPLAFLGNDSATSAT